MDGINTMAQNVTHPGQNEGTGAIDAKLLKLFKGEILNAFSNACIGTGLVTTKTISGGKSEQFIVIDTFNDTDVLTHTPGTDLTTTILSTNEKTITVSDKKYIAAFIDVLDQKLEQFDTRSELVQAQGVGVAQKVDKAIFRGIYDSRLVAPVSGQTASVAVTNTVIASATTPGAKGDAIIEAIGEAQAGLSLNGVPEDGRACVVNSTRQFQIAQSAKAVNADYNGGNGSNGTIATGKVMSILGVDIYVSNNMPTLEVDGLTATNLVGMIFTKGIYGVVTALGLTTEVNYDFNKLGYAVNTFYALGMGTLNPSCLAVIKSA